ncbi:CGNR zinc finger domain-containing protein [Streptomyces cavernicola]|uniref:CGNR zinc finger domain-containing protein n=1 Tax=Streptomyces cavernicola TaxID=3043613 RepID=A0ABT6SHH2_9ACTN|nr:CGNR zinc finger domain-containing protein [Streptomyces sp. B-S-A6]MDI3407620.1 CGNR zinc finger domain-containing protein [Streptomyces sp. B-S-A6]
MMYGRSFHFDPGALCLELLPTGGAERYPQFESLHEPADLGAWAAETRIGAGLEVTVDEQELAAAYALRAALWSLAEARAGDAALDPAPLAVLNAAAAAPPLVARLLPDGTRAWAEGATGSALLSTVARDAIELFTGPYAHRVRACEADNCALLFADTSRAGRRRWCSMERCGNRNKVRTHRAKN